MFPHIIKLPKSIDKPADQITTSYDQLLPKDHPYFELLQPILKKLPQLFDIKLEPEPKVPETEYNLKIYITQSQDQRLNNFIYTYTMPVPMQKFIAATEDLELQKKLDVNIAKYQVLKTIDQNTKIMYLQYKKVLIVSGRDFVYVRFCFRKGNQFWIISTSIPGEPEHPGVIRGSIVKSAQKIVEKEGKIQICIYSEVDMKMQMKPEAAKPKGVFEIKKYVQKCFEHFMSQGNPKKQQVNI